MSEIEKAIKIAEDKNICEFCGDCGNDDVCIKCKKVASVPIDDLRNFYSVAIQALREKAERENPKPLTVKQLEKMNGQAVFCVDAKGNGKWALVHSGNDVCTDGDFGDWEFYEYAHKNEYGWHAYRYKPKHIGEANDMQELEKYPNGWIPVSERLPESHKTVLCQYRNGDIHIDFYGHTGFTHIFSGEVVAWQYLPEPYKGVEE